MRKAIWAVFAIVIVTFYCSLSQPIQAQTTTGCESTNPKLVSIATVFEQTLKEKGVKAASAQYYMLKREQPDTYDFGENELNELGYRLMAEECFQAAVDVLGFNLELFPSSWNAYDSMGEAYMNAGKKKLAIASYQKSLALNPGNKSGGRTLDQLLYKSLNDTLLSIVRTQRAPAAVSYYQQMRRQKPNVYNFKEYVLDDVAYRLIGQRKITDAIELLRLNAEVYPRSSSACNSLGEAYILAGDTAAAIEWFAAGSVLNPSDRVCSEMLRMLQPVQAGDFTIPNVLPPREYLEIKEGSCGEACLATIFKAHGLDVPQLLLNRAGGGPGRGLHSDELFAVLDKYGINYQIRYKTCVKNLRDFLDSNVTAPVKLGNPVLIGVKIYPDRHPEWSLDHFILVVGYNIAAGEFIFNDFGRRRRITITKLIDKNEGYSLINARASAYAIEFPLALGNQPR